MTSSVSVTNSKLVGVSSKNVVITNIQPLRIPLTGGRMILFPRVRKNFRRTSNCSAKLFQSLGSGKSGERDGNNPEVENLDLAAETERSQEKLDTVVIFLYFTV